MTKNYMPKNFTENMEMMDWKATLINFLKYQPGRNGFPLKNVIRDKVAAIVQTNTTFLDDCVYKELFQPKTSNFCTRALILVDYKLVH